MSVDELGKQCIINAAKTSMSSKVIGPYPYFARNVINVIFHKIDLVVNLYMYVMHTLQVSDLNLKKSVMTNSLPQWPSMLLMQ